MARTIVAVTVILLASADAAWAQLSVIDPSNLRQTVLIAERTQRHLEELQAQFRTILRMSRGLGDLDRYRTPPIVGTSHNPIRWPYAAAWLQGLNAGDPAGNAYGATIVGLKPIDSLPQSMSAAAHRTFSNQIASMELSDSVAMMAGHQIGAIRQYNGVLQKGVNSLEDDVMNGLARYHELTAILDKVAAGELLGRRQDMAANQLLSHAIEQLLARGKRLRDAEALTMNMQFTTWRDGRRVNEAMVAGTADALRTWRQP
jgi:hypothetical protein